MVVCALVVSLLVIMMALFRGCKEFPDGKDFPCGDQHGICIERFAADMLWRLGGIGNGLAAGKKVRKGNIHAVLHGSRSIYRAGLISLPVLITSSFGSA